MNLRIALIPLEGGDPFEVAKEMVVVGRQEECELRLDHKSVSKAHCVLVKTDGLLVLRDLGSTNGTRVNGTRVRRAALLPNDKVSFANCHFQVHIGPRELPIADANERTIGVDGHNGLLDGDDSDEEPSLGIQRNELPDVYPDDSPKKKRKR
ncbi:MAG: FHA domain-containing protein [Gemmataceae bacterium]|nr:FHA domain-containing protein [Gemmataceae bacterium]